jgi:hypothetical protein
VNLNELEFGTQRVLNLTWPVLPPIVGDYPKLGRACLAQSASGRGTSLFVKNPLFFAFFTIHRHYFNQNPPVLSFSVLKSTNAEEKV